MVGEEPFRGESNPVIAQKVLNGERMSIPLHIDVKVSEIMRSCWRQLPNDRPNIVSVCQMLDERLFELQQEESSRSKLVEIFSTLKSGHILTKIPFASGRRRMRKQHRFFRVTDDLRKFTWSRTVGSGGRRGEKVK